MERQLPEIVVTFNQDVAHPSSCGLSGKIETFSERALPAGYENDSRILIGRLSLEGLFQGRNMRNCDANATQPRFPFRCLPTSLEA
jgi:hypothetical protein